MQKLRVHENETKKPGGTQSREGERPGGTKAEEDKGRPGNRRRGRGADGGVANDGGSLQLWLDLSFLLRFSPPRIFS